MPRPERYRERETEAAAVVKSQEGADPPAAAASAVVVPKIPKRRGTIAPPAPDLDDSPPDEQRSAKDAPSEAERALADRLARRMGWKPKEEWERDPAKWVDSITFLERTPTEVSTLKERLKRTGQVADSVIAEQRRLAREEAERELREAAKAGDENKAVEAAKKVASANAPLPETEAWIARNSWFKTDAAAAAVALAVSKKAAAEGLSNAEQLEAAETEVRRRFPELFDGGGNHAAPPRPEPRETTLSQTTRSAPAVTGGSRTQARESGTRERGFRDIPGADRNQMRVFIQKYMRMGLTQDAAEARLASAYWANKDAG